jgi:hypothetical protein
MTAADRAARPRGVPTRPQPAGPGGSSEPARLCRVRRRLSCIRCGRGRSERGAGAGDRIRSRFCNRTGTSSAFLGTRHGITSTGRGRGAGRRNVFGRAGVSACGRARSRLRIAGRVGIAAGRRARQTARTAGSSRVPCRCGADRTRAARSPTATRQSRLSGKTGTVTTSVILLRAFSS